MSIENLPTTFIVDFGLGGNNKCIAVNNEYFYKSQYQNDFGDLDFNDEIVKNILPDLDEGNVGDKTISTIDWNKGDTSLTRICFATGYTYFYDLTEENYNKYCKPYADIWQQIKDQKDQEEAEAEAERNKFENRQARALIQLNVDFETVKKRAHIMSSLGFTVDANSTANENITGLLLTLADDATCQFCDYYNQFHELNKIQLTTLRNEIIQNAQNLYNQKWQYRTAIENCVDNDGLDAVIETIEFTYSDFSQTTE